jgi:hypothetical protein
MSDSDGNLLVTIFCILLAIFATLIIWAIAKKLFSKSI